MLKLPKKYKPSTGLLSYLTLFRVMEDDKKWNELLKGVCNFCEEHMKEEPTAKGPLGI